jgi:hypothetical protein
LPVGRSRDLARDTVFAPQSRKLADREVTPLTRPEPFVGDPGERKPRQAAHGEARGFTEAMDLPVLSLAKNDAKLGLPPFHREPCDLCRLGRTPADVDALAEAGKVAILDHSFYLCDVHLGRLLPRVQKREGEVAVIRQEQRSGRSEVEPPHGDDPRPDSCHVLGDRGASSWIRHRADHIARLVKHQVHEPLARDRAAVHLDAVVLRIRLRAELRHDPSVDGHATRRDQRLGGSARRDASGGQDFLKAFARHGPAL